MDDGIVSHIGVSNFSEKGLRELLAFARIKPVVNQIELHPLFSQRRLVGACLRLVCSNHKHALTFTCAYRRAFAHTHVRTHAHTAQLWYPYKQAVACSIALTSTGSRYRLMIYDPEWIA